MTNVCYLDRTNGKCYISLMLSKNRNSPKETYITYQELFGEQHIWTERYLDFKRQKINDATEGSVLRYQPIKKEHANIESFDAFYRHKYVFGVVYASLSTIQKEGPAVYKYIQEHFPDKEIVNVDDIILSVMHELKQKRKIRTIKPRLEYGKLMDKAATMEEYQSLVRELLLLRTDMIICERIWNYD